MYVFSLTKQEILSGTSGSVSTRTLPRVGGEDEVQTAQYRQ